MEARLNERGEVEVVYVYGVLARMSTSGVLTCLVPGGVPILETGFAQQLWTKIQNAEVEAHECRANRCESNGNLDGFKAYSQVAIYIASLKLDDYIKSVIIQ